MTSDRLVDAPFRRRPGINGLLQLGLPHFWLLSGILGMMLGLVLLIVFTRLLSQ